MKNYLRYIVAALLVLILGYFVTNFFVSKKVKSLLDEEDNLSYSDLSVNAFTGNLSLKQVKFYDDDKKIEIDKIELNIEIVQYLMKDEIIIEYIDAEKLDVKLMTSKDAKETEGDKPEIVRIENINIKDANVTIKNEDKVSFEVSHLNLKAEDINWPLDENYEWSKNKSIDISAKDISFSMDILHDLKSETFTFNNQSIVLENFLIEPKFSKAEYINHIETEKDLMDLKSKSLKIFDFELQKKDNLLHIISSKIKIDSTDFNIYRDKSIADDTSTKLLYSQALRELNFQISVDSLLISDMELTYQELLDHDRNVGEIKFNSIKAQVLNIHNSLKADNSKIKVEAQAKFSKGSEIAFSLNFTPDHEQFYVSTYLKQIEDKSINNFIAPAIRIEIDGVIDEIKTSFTGNNSEMNGDFNIAYENLKLNILKKDGTKNNFASLISNAIMRNKDVNDHYELKKVKRDKTKSFWNYVWTFHLDGLKKCLL